MSMLYVIPAFLMVLNIQIILLLCKNFFQNMLKKCALQLCILHFQAIILFASARLCADNDCLIKVISKYLLRVIFMEEKQDPSIGILTGISTRLKRGKRLGKYRLEKRLGRGGYCEVWKARDCIEGIWVALKIPNTDRYGQRDNKQLLREIRLVSSLRHPNIMRVKNAEIVKGYAILASELSTGTLDDCTKPMGLKRLITIMNEVLEGLAYAHSKKMVHCDVTPGNIFLFGNGVAKLGDFGISVQLKGRAHTIDEFGTPGYVAPEQAYGRPSYRSDCFSVGVILYEYITGYQPRWPFHWPFKHYDKLKERTSLDFVRFIKKSLSVDPAGRFANAGRMLEGMRESLPLSLQKGISVRLVRPKSGDWQQMRREAFIRRYRRVMGNFTSCVDCGEPVSEQMKVCPWCGSDKNKFDYVTNLEHVCPRCRRGIKSEWAYCPWCYGGGFEPVENSITTKYKYHGRCGYCDGRMSRFMRYCPWCRRKRRKGWVVWPFPETCRKCGWSVDSAFWRYCPWCENVIV